MCSKKMIDCRHMLVVTVQYISLKPIIVKSRLDNLQILSAEFAYGSYR